MNGEESGQNKPQGLKILVHAPVSSLPQPGYVRGGRSSHLTSQQLVRACLRTGAQLPRATTAMMMMLMMVGDG